MRKTSVLCFIALTMVVAGTGPATAQVVLWNKLGSEAELLNSETGVDGTFAAPIGFGTVQHGDGVSIKSGTSQVRFDQVFGTNFPDAGTIEFWWIPVREEAGSSSHHDERIPLWFACDERGDGYWPSILFGVYYGTHGVTSVSFSVWDDDSSANFSNNRNYDLDFSAGQLMHFALVWNKAWGVSPLKLYVDGVEQVPTYEDQTSSDLIIDTIQEKIQLPGFTYDIELLRRSKRLDGAQWEHDTEMYVDNLVVWNAALDDFSHRFDENPVAQIPFVNKWGLTALTAVLLLVISIAVALRKRRTVPS